MTKPDEKISAEHVCPKCDAPLAEITTTKTGKQLQRCSKGSWDSDTRESVGCDFVKWLETPPQELDEKCPKCGNKLILAVTRFGKKMKKCSAGTWDRETKKTIGCDFIEWINGTTEPLDEDCPDCGKKLVLFTTVNGKKMKKCSTSGWDKTERKATGCPYVYWLKPQEYPQPTEKSDNGGEEFLPPEQEG